MRKEPGRVLDNKYTREFYDVTEYKHPVYANPVKEISEQLKNMKLEKEKIIPTESLKTRISMTLESYGVGVSYTSGYLRYLIISNVIKRKGRKYHIILVE